MAELKCPHCGQAFTVDDTELSSIVSQIRDKEFEKDLSQRTSELERHLKERHELELSAKENELRVSQAKELDALREQIRKIEESNTKLKLELDNVDDKKKLAVLEAVKKVEDEKNALADELSEKNKS